MPSQRRVRVFGLLAIVAVVCIIFYTGSMRESHPRDLSTSGDFYSKTMDALDKNSASSEDTDKKVAAKVETGKGVKDDAEDAQVAKEMAQRLKEAAQAAKEKANAKSPKPDPPSSIVGVGSAANQQGVAGRKKYPADGAQEVVKEEEEIETPERRAAKTELDKILKKAPMIIFSKSYCPHSRRAKGILLDKYIIDPLPHVVELDQHEIGADLQSLLADKTGRRTVPNVLINGVSIGGGDDVAALDENKTLIAKVNELGGTHILGVKMRPVEASAEGHGLR